MIGFSGKKQLARLLVCIFFISISASAQEAQTNGLPALLNEIPLSSFESGWLSYADYEVLAEHNGTSLPHNLQEAQSLSNEQTDALFSVFMSISAGPTDFLRSLPQGQEVFLASGVDFFSVRRALEIGVSPARQLWLEGRFDSETIAEALLQKGYLQTANTVTDRQTWAPGGDITAGNRMDLSKRDPAFLFGGDLGQSWPVILQPGVLASTPDKLGAQAIAQGEIPTLMGHNELMSGVSVLLQQGDVAQMYALTPEAGGLVIAGENALPRYELILLAHVFSEDAQHVIIALVYDDENAIAAAGELLTSRMMEEVTLPSGEVLQSLVSQHRGEIVYPFVYDATGNPVLITAFSFPLPHEAQGGSSRSPFRLFSDMLLRRDLGWLATAEAK